MTQRDRALGALRTADNRAGDAQVGDYSQAMALIGIGHAILDLTDLIRSLASEDTPETAL